MKTSNCCDAYVNPDLMICSDCKEHCGFVEEWEESFDKQFVVNNGEDVELVFKDQSDVSSVKQFIRELIQNNDKKGL